MFALVLLALAPTVHATEQGDVLLNLEAGWVWTSPDETIDSTWTIVPRFGYMFTDRLGIELEAGWMQGQTRVEWLSPTGETQGHYLYNAFTPRVDLLVNIMPHWPVEPFVAVGPGFIYKNVNRAGSVASDAPPPEGWGNYVNPDTDFLINAGPGVFVNIIGPLRFRADLRWFGNIGNEPHGDRQDFFSDLELTAGLGLALGTGPKDRDGDGYVDKEDDCPDDPEDFDRFEDEDGCPEDDNDRDGVLDWDDDCPLRPEDLDSFEDNDGCPDPDNDSDGILDVNDSCPNKPEDKDAFEDEDGCPDLDNDKDEIPDVKDKCPNDPEDRDGWMDGDGCADPDNDKDGILDVDDTCPDDPETYNGFEDKDGCPDEMPAEMERFTGVIRGINFEVNKAIIKPESYRLLNEAAEVLIKFPDMRIEVQGHTDSDGSDSYNLELSDRRAAAVVDYLVAAGVESSRLSSIGYGESQPIASNSTREGKAENRRVEFRITSGEATMERVKE